jgi:hypothetical protein
VSTKEEMLDFTRKLRGKFKETIKEFEILPLSSKPKRLHF